MNTPSRIAPLLLLGLTSAFAGPVTTVPWNGHTGAVSFTYDDARDGQIPNLLPQLDSLGIKATFEIAASNVGTFENRLSSWMQVSRNGHELANHTYYHINVPTTDPAATDTVHHMATYLRGLDTSIQSITFAYPNCVVGGDNGVSSENFIGRGCGTTTYAWGTQPSDWMNIQGLIITSSPNTVTSAAVPLLNGAKTSNGWVITIIHDVVNPPPNQYSLTPADNLTVLKAGVSNNLWIDTYMHVGAYYRAHFTMDTAKAATVTGGWSLAWTSPHPKMPKSVPLRVKLASATFGTSFTVLQGGTVIPPQNDSSYIIDFMKLSLSVLQGTSGVKARRFLPSKLQVQMTQNGLLLGGLVGEVEATVSDVHGKTLFHGRVSESNHVVPLREDQLHGILFLTLANPVTRASIHTLINAVR